MVGLVVVMLLFAGCGGGGGSGDNGTNGTVAGENETTAAADAETTAAESGEETTTESGMTETATATATPTATETPTATPTPTATVTETVVGNTSTNATTTGNASPNETAPGDLDLNATPSGPNDDQFFLDRLELLVTQSNYTVNSIGMEGDTVTLEYVTNATDESAALQEMGMISGGYAGLMSGGWNTEGMNVTVVSSAGEPISTFHVESSWAEQYNNEEISATEYIQLVRGTSETPSGGNETTATPTAEASA